MTLSYLEPPYLQPASQCPLQPPIGAVLIADLSGGIPALSLALARAREAPWCPLVSLLADRSIPAADLTAFEPVLGTWATLYPNDYAHLPLGERAMSEVGRRSIPQATTVAQWVEARLGITGSASVLAACFGDGGDEIRPPRTLTRRVQALGPLEVRDWRGLARLAQLLAGRTPRTAPPLETVAYEAMIDPRTLRRWLRLATDLSWSEATARAGWEWALESALRSYGYVPHRRPERVNAGFARSAPAPRRP